MTRAAASKVVTIISKISALDIGCVAVGLMLGIVSIWAIAFVAAVVNRCW